MTKHDEIKALLTEIRDRLPEPHDPVGSRCRRDYCEELHKPAPADDLPGEPVEPGDLRAGDRVEFTFEGERITGTLVSVREGAILRSDTPDKDDYYPNVVVQGKWCSAISDVRLIERAPREDEDPDESDSFYWMERAEKAEAERDEWKADAVARKRVVNNRGEQIASLTERNVDLTAERDGWKAKHAALREDVERGARYWNSYESSGKHTQNVARAAGYDLTAYLDRDAERTPQDDPDTVTLRREDAEALSKFWLATPAYGEGGKYVSRVARDVLGLGDEA